MNEITRSQKSSELFKELCNRYPNSNPRIIEKAINQFDCDIIKINAYLRKQSMDSSMNTSSNDSARRKSDESDNAKVYSFISMNSDNSGYSSPGQIPKTYRSSMDLSKISMQKTDLEKLGEAYKRLENHLDYLNSETIYLGEVIERRKSEIAFPNLDQVEYLDRRVNKPLAMPIKSISYANDLRQPSELNQRYAGFHGIYNPNPINDNGNNHRLMNNPQRSDMGQYLIRDQMNPNLFYSPQQIEDHLAPFKKVSEKRYSAHLDPAIDIPQEFTAPALPRAGHQRQRSDPWLIDRPLMWYCPQCYTENRSSHCSFCQYSPNSNP